MNNQTVILFIVMIVALSFGIWSELISFNEKCGWEFPADQHPDKNWACKCAGQVKMSVTEDTEEFYCTGLNLSYNKLLNLPSSKTSQKPVYSQKTPIKNLRVSVVYIDDRKPVKTGTIQIRDQDAKTVKIHELGETGVASFNIPEGIYTVEMKDGFSGQETVNLKDNDEVTLKVISVFN